MDPTAIILYQHVAPVGFAAFPGPSDNTTRRSNRSPTRSFPRPPLREREPVVEESSDSRTGDISSDVLLLAAGYEDAVGRNSESVPTGERCRERVCLVFLSSSGSPIPPGPDFFIRTILTKCSSIKEHRWFPEEVPADHPEKATRQSWSLTSRG